MPNPCSSGGGCGLPARMRGLPGVAASAPPAPCGRRAPPAAAHSPSPARPAGRPWPPLLLRVPGRGPPPRPPPPPPVSPPSMSLMRPSVDDDDDDDTVPAPATWRCSPVVALGAHTMGSTPTAPTSSIPASNAGTNMLDAAPFELRPPLAPLLPRPVLRGVASLPLPPPPPPAPLPAPATLRLNPMAASRPPPPPLALLLVLLLAPLLPLLPPLPLLLLPLPTPPLPPLLLSLVLVMRPAAAPCSTRPCCGLLPSCTNILRASAFQQRKLLLSLLVAQLSLLLPHVSNHTTAQADEMGGDGVATQPGW